MLRKEFVAICCAELLLPPPAPPPKIGGGFVRLSFLKQLALMRVGRPHPLPAAGRHPSPEREGAKILLCFFYKQLALTGPRFISAHSSIGRVLHFAEGLFKVGD